MEERKGRVGRRNNKDKCIQIISKIKSLYEEIKARDERGDK